MAGEFIRFSMVGVVGLIVNLAVLNGFLAVAPDPLPLLGDPRYGGEALAYLVASTATWWCNRHFTFTGRSHAPMLRQWARFLAVNSAGALANYVTYSTLVATISICHAIPSIAVCVGSVVGLAFNFPASRLLVFRR